jgi:ribosomal protein S18 acetylase RimI-like enzyme
MSDPVSVREARREDAWGIARVRVDTWRVAYDGLIDDRILAALDPEREGHRRAELWLENTAAAGAAQFVAEQNGVIVGWAAVGACRDDDRPGTGELHAIYVHPSLWSAGVGHELLAAATASLRSSGFAEASLWVLDHNVRAAGFYERHGWIEDGAVKSEQSSLAEAPPLFERRRVIRFE